MSNFSSIAQAVIDGEVARVQELVDFALNTKLLTAEQILSVHLYPGMREVGEQFRSNEIHIPEVLLASRAFHAGISKIKADMPDNSHRKKGTVVLGTVAGDLHDIGKRLVSIFLRNFGYEVVDVGIDVSPEDFANHIRNHKPDVLGMSALLDTTTVWMNETIKYLKKQKLLQNCKVIVGGAPVTSELALEMGADGYAGDAMEAVLCIDRLLGFSSEGTEK